MYVIKQNFLVEVQVRIVRPLLRCHVACSNTQKALQVVLLFVSSLF